MSERKRPRPEAGPPTKLPSADAIEQIIANAQAAGEFDDLEGKGKPFSDRGRPYDPGWWARKLVERERINIVPPALEIRRKIEALLEGLDRYETESEVGAATDRLNAEIAHLNARVTSGPATAVSRLDPASVLARWRKLRGRAGGSMPEGE